MFPTLFYYILLIWEVAKQKHNVTLSWNYYNVKALWYFGIAISLYEKTLLNIVWYNIKWNIFFIDIGISKILNKVSISLKLEICVAIADNKKSCVFIIK